MTDHLQLFWTQISYNLNDSKQSCPFFLYQILELMMHRLDLSGRNLDSFFTYLYFTYLYQILGYKEISPCARARLDRID